MFRLKTDGTLKYYTADELEETGLIKHCFTTRCGGVSTGGFSSMNLRMNSGDSRENILKNYSIICNEIGVDYKKLVLSHQVHEDKIIKVSAADCGNGIVKPQKFASADALITAQPGVPLAVFGADCVPVILLDTENAAIGLAHSGWRGTAACIAAKTVQKMVSEFNCSPQKIRAAIGPSIRVCHFEVGDEIAEIFREKFGEAVLEKHAKYHVDMQKAIELQLVAQGVPPENITDSNLCTFCNDDLFYSHRKTGNRRGVMAAIAEINGRE